MKAKKLTKLLSSEDIEQKKMSAAVASWQMSPFLNEEEQLQQALDEEAAEVEQLKQEEAEIEAIKAEARKEGYEAGFNQGLDSGHQQGYQEGIAQAKSEIAEAIREQAQVLEQTLNMISQPISYVEEGVYQQLALFSLAVAENIIDSHVETDVNWLAERLQKTIQKIPEVVVPLEIMISPRDKQVIEQVLSEHKDWVPKGWHLIEEATLPSGCLKIKHQKSVIENNWVEQKEAYFSDLIQRIFYSDSSS